MAERNAPRAVAIRAARPEDREFVLGTAARLADFGPPPWRTVAEVVAGESRALQAFFESAPERSALLVAEDSGGRPLGFAYLETQLDFFTRRPHAHLAELAVSREAEGLGAGGALLSASEDWARAQGYSVLTLNVFDENRHARDVYERRGFAPEYVRYIKSLG
jgi:GNAT superfamily N-acetyltransferase